MAFELPPLPYERDALSPYISSETLDYHYGKHHKSYVDKLNGLVAGSAWENKSLEELIEQADGGVFNNAAQIWNHSFYWQCLQANGGNEPEGDLAQAICDAFGDFDSFKKQFTQAALTQFGSGWAWLVRQSDGQLAILSTGNADNPMRDGHHPIMTCDVWEHAYYIDTRNDRAKYLENFWQLVNWSFVSQQLVAHQA
jgi:superoxide dismutase, Fe-Mn family